MRARRWLMALASGVLVPAAMLTAPAQAGNSTMTTHYIVYVTYYSDPGLTNVTGARTWSDCPGEEGSWGWGGGAYHTTVAEECP